MTGDSVSISLARDSSNASAREAVVDDLHQLDMSDLSGIPESMSRLSVLVLGAAHKKASPAFDFHLSHLPALVYSLRVLVREFAAQPIDWLIRGTWLLVVLAYVTQLRPRLDESPVYSFALSDGQMSWEALFNSIHAKPDRLKGKHADPHFLRALKSIYA